MGVKNLWNLLAPAARPIELESLNRKILAIDILIYFVKITINFFRPMRDKDGNILKNAHVLGFLRRLCKLLFFNIKPIFVFDGGAPELKRVTLTKRHKRRSGKANELQKTAEKLLAAQMKVRVINDIDGSKSNNNHNNNNNNNNKDNSKQEVIIDDNTIYYDEIKLNPTKIRQRKRNDEFELPPISGSLESMMTDDDPRLATADDLLRFIEKYKPEDIDTSSEAFQSLPLSKQYEIISELRQKSRISTRDRYKELVESAPISFFIKTVFFFFFEFYLL
ncbi:hypothetical protein Glove_146g37 [Diversispora epigaea]|uniref:XPG N-terminal domain-containing protein n=1 Tax=Diversispora epigaea TaxID=1348612 RepID=A0A397IWL1_9GLOM|nr:hypothetical protein Glove_146g37 [Diversispora epigaea]